MGRIVKYDRLRGFGFIEPDDGTEDIFVHAAEVGWGDDPIPIGARVEYSAVNGDRGRRAAGARLLTPVATTARTENPVAIAKANGTVAVQAASTVAAKAEDEIIEVLPVGEFAAQITEVLMDALPDATAAQMLIVRKRLTQMALDNGWVDPQ
jgi:cold shock CspA family protein